MKKILAVILAAVLVFSFCGCGIPFTAEKIIGDSEIYSERDIEAAMDVVFRKFCTFEFSVLTELEYDEEFSDNMLEYNTEVYKADEAIVLRSKFIDLRKGTLEWNWTLVRARGGEWELKTWGYC